ncbi:hypothetical protein VTO42DRAFT_7106 [Malbranchea cinnamomea]
MALGEPHALWVHKCGSRVQTEKSGKRDTLSNAPGRSRWEIVVDRSSTSVLDGTISAKQPTQNLPDPFASCLWIFVTVDQFFPIGLSRSKATGGLNHPIRLKVFSRQFSFFSSSSSPSSSCLSSSELGRATNETRRWSWLSENCCYRQLKDSVNYDRKHRKEV